MLMKKGNVAMKCLEIKDGKGFFRNRNGEMETLDKIKRDDILHLLDIATSKQETFEMDDIESAIINNQAHIIIYRNLGDKFKEILNNKTRFLDESENIYKEALQKYQ